MTMLSIFEVDIADPGPEIVDVIPNRPQGHIGLVTEGERPSRVSFVDLGDGLDLWVGQAVHFSIDTARQLGEELIAWAELRSTRKEN